ncbi:MAG: ureidoglycolate lyase [Pseudomonadota bacterium]
MTILRPTALNASDFEPFGDIIDTEGAPDIIINQGRCGRYHDRATLDFCAGNAGISLFHTDLVTWPITISVMERHPLGSQAFIPMSHAPFLVVVAHDKVGMPDSPKALMTAPGQAINIHRNIWHAPLLALHAPGLFAIIDRIGPESNLEEYILEQDYIIEQDIH